MFTVPFAVFFLAKHICDDIYHFDIFASNVISVISAVVAVNVIIFLYVYHNMKQHVQLQEEDEKAKTDWIECGGSLKLSSEGKRRDHSPYYP